MDLAAFSLRRLTHPWAVTSVGGTHVCLRAIDPVEVFRLIDAEDVTHMAAAPIVLSMLIHAPDDVKPRTERSVPVQQTGAQPTKQGD